MHGLPFSLLPANLSVETIIVNSAVGKITHVPLMIIFGFVGLAYKLYLWAFLSKKKKKIFLFLIHSFWAKFQAYITRKRWNPILRQTRCRLRKMFLSFVPPERPP